jgi:hypothetical protein
LSGTSVRPFGGDERVANGPVFSTRFISNSLLTYIYFYSFVFVVVIRSAITATLYINSPTAWTFSHLGKLKKKKTEKIKNCF